MKKNQIFILLGVIFILLVGFFLIQKMGWEEKEMKFDSKSDAEILNYNYPMTDENKKYFLEWDEFDTYILGGPYYMGNNKLIWAGLDDYEKFREIKIQEAIDLTEETFTSSKELYDILEDYKWNLTYIWWILIQEDSNIKKEENLLAEYLIEYKLKEDGLMVLYESIETSSDIPAVQANMEYRKTAASVQLATVLIEDINYLMTYSALITDRYENTYNTNIQKAIKLFDKEMEWLEKAIDITRNLQIDIYAIDMALKQLEAGEYYIGMASIMAIEAKLPEIKSMIDNLQANDDITKEDIDFFQDYANFFQDYVDGYKSSMWEVTPPEIPETAYLHFPIIQEVNAKSKSYWNKAMGALKSGAKTLIKWGSYVIDKSLTRTWVKKQFQIVRKGAWLTVASVNVAAKSWFDMYFWRSYWLKTKEVGASIMENFNKFDKEVKSGTAGSEVYKTAWEYLEWIDKKSEEIAGETVEKMIWKWRVSKFAWWLWKSAGNIFTGFGQWVYKIANPKSTKWEIAEWVLDVWLSLVWGSKSIVKWSTLLKTAGKSSKTIWVTGLKYIGKTESKATLKGAISNGLKKAVSEWIDSGMKTVNQNVTSRFSKLLKNWRKTLWKNIPETMKSSYKEFVKEKFEHSFKDYVKSIKWIIGKSPKDFFDNAFANEVDGWLKKTVKEAIDNEKKGDDDDEDEDDDEDSDDEDDDSEDEEEWSDNDSELKSDWNNEDNYSDEDYDEEDSEDEEENSIDPDSDLDKKNSNSEEKKEDEKDSDEKDKLWDNTDSEDIDDDADKKEPNVIIRKEPDYSKMVGDVVLILEEGYPPGAETNSVDPQALIRYELFNSLAPIVLKDKNFSFSNSQSFNIPWAYKHIWSSNINGNGIYDNSSATISWNFVYSWNGIVGWGGGGGDTKTTITYSCGFSSTKIPTTGNIYLTTTWNIVTTRISGGRKPWTVTSSWCPNLSLKVKWLDK